MNETVREKQRVNDYMGQQLKQGLEQNFTIVV